MGIIWDQTQKFAHHDFANSDCIKYIQYAECHRNDEPEYDQFGIRCKHFDDINDQDEFGSTVLIICGKINRDNFSRTEAAKHLIDAGADVNLQDNFGRTALMRSKYADFTNLLIQRGADISMVDEVGKTALFPYDFYQSSYEPLIVDHLVAAGSNVNHTDKEGRTALMCSLNIELSEKLIKHGADVNIKDRQGYTALMHIVELVSVHSESEEELLKLADLLILNGANVDKFINSNTVVMRPKIKSHLENQFLIKSADVSEHKHTFNQSNIKARI